MVKPNLRTRSIGTKGSEDEYAQHERAAQMSAKTVGEWCHKLAESGIESGTVSAGEKGSHFGRFKSKPVIQ